MAPPTLTKSLFTAGVRCHKLLWWRVHEPNAVELQPDTVLQDLFDQGRQVGELARTRFPGGTLIPPHDARSARVEATRQAIAAGATVIYEAAFDADSVFVSADVLEKNESGWRMIEVKLASECKDEHIPDAGVQAHVLAQSGITLGSTHVMHMNKEFRHPDTGELFGREDVTERVRTYVAGVPEEVRLQLEALAGSEPPTVSIGLHCGGSHPCVFHDRCWPNDERHIGTLFNVGIAKTVAYMARGIHRIDDLPAKEKLQPAQRRQLRAMETGQMIVEPTLARDLEPFNVEPLGVLDFETVYRAVPVWDGMKPWEQAPAQLSYHESLPDGTYRHEEYLAEGPSDSRQELARRLVNATRNAVKVVHYSPFEKTRIRALQVCVPELAQELKELEEKLIDLAPVLKDNVYHPLFKGSFSLKFVLTALVPELSYNDLVIVDGRVASVEIARLLFVADRIPPDERDRVRADLLAYCKMDTWATVRLVEELRAMVRLSLPRGKSSSSAL